MIIILTKESDYCLGGIRISQGPNEYDEEGNIQEYTFPWEEDHLIVSPNVYEALLEMLENKEL